MSWEAQSEGRHNQTVNIHPSKNRQSAHFHKDPKLNFILFVFYSSTPGNMYVQECQLLLHISDRGGPPIKFIFAPQESLT